jgi:hypothetical protein
MYADGARVICSSEGLATGSGHAGTEGLATSRIPAIEAPQEPPEPPLTREEEPRRARTSARSGEAQDGSNRSKVDVVSDNVQFLDG